MKKLLLATAFFILPATSFAAGPYDGIYSINISGIGLIGYTSIHENDNSEMIAIIIEPNPNDATWEALSGTRTDNSAQLKSIAGTVVLDVSVVFNDAQSANATIISCVDENIVNNENDCDFPNGAVLNLNKVF